MLAKLKSHIRSWWSWWYLIDWTISLLVFIPTVIIGEFALPTFQRYRVWTIPGVRGEQYLYPKLSSFVPTWLLIILCLIPIAIFALVQIRVQSLHDFHHALLSLIKSNAINSLITHVMKRFAGSYRPYFMSICNPDALGNCQNSGKEVADGQTGFPSGHSSTAFATFLVLCYYLSGKTGLFTARGGQCWKFLISWIWIVIPLAVSITRTMDYHHDFVDIVGGTMLGCCCATIGYFMHYYSLLSKKSHLPKNAYVQRNESYHKEENEKQEV